MFLDIPTMKSTEKLLKTVKKLRSPKGCPWDKKQTHKSLKRYLIEESYETLEAIDKNNSKLLMEELGDVLLQIALHSQIASEKKQFTFNDVANHINKKMISRHPHVFSNIKVKNVDEVMTNWEAIKKTEDSKRKDIFHGIPIALPALLKSLKTSKKAAREGFEWKKEYEIWQSLNSEIKEFKHASKKHKKEELGDILFTIVNIARWHKIDPEDALNTATNKFMSRVKKTQKLAGKSNTKDISYLKLNKLWKKAKSKYTGKI